MRSRKQPAFRNALRVRLCLIPADGFYECQKVSKGKQPFCFEVADGELFAFAGLWDRWKDRNGEVVESCSILSTIPSDDYQLQTQLENIAFALAEAELSEEQIVLIQAQLSSVREELVLLSGGVSLN